MDFTSITNMMMSWTEDTFHITHILWGETTGDKGIPLTKGMQTFNDFFFVSLNKQLTVPMIWDPMTLMY